MSKMKHCSLFLFIALFISCQSSSWDDGISTGASCSMMFDNSTVFSFNYDNHILLDGKELEVYTYPTKEYSSTMFRTNIRMFDLSSDLFRWKNLFTNDLLIVDMFKYSSANNEYYIIITAEDDSDGNGIISGARGDRDELSFYLYLPEVKVLREIITPGKNISDYYIYNCDVEILYKSRNDAAYFPMLFFDNHIIFPTKNKNTENYEILLYSIETDDVANCDGFLE
ncbi:MAG: hypothetical protein PQJ59_19200 [Spirochaetales bacterium]|nr:hypothetical protein [Spirochaetales bacterium]